MLIPLKSKSEVNKSVWQALVSHQDPLNDDYDVTAFLHFYSMRRIKERALRKEVGRRKGELDAISKDIALTLARANLPDDPEERAEMESLASKVRANRKALLQLLKQRKQDEQRQDTVTGRMNSDVDLLD